MNDYLLNEILWFKHRSARKAQRIVKVKQGIVDLHRAGKIDRQTAESLAKRIRTIEASAYGIDRS